MPCVLGFISALLLRIVSRGWAAELCRQDRNQRLLSWAPFYLSQRSSYRSVCTAPLETVTYKELKQLLKSNKIVVIDVREPWEIKAYGQIPGSINVPLGQVEQALKLDPSSFMETYNGKMPSTSDKIVFSCLAGIRSKKALDAAASMGYSRALHFPGGWEEWMKHEFSEKQH
ncbi:thiosulfate sulfurtransferase/rhodanese-like domain-containing protein 3 [Heterodontus francisci]|uniref:thiosulfate sulfurtransferase/rhodanese-like domain-containing protein 3 n=1 Tax=Heterodontus francisci TaxID=7792 RepID=UPI00355C1177